MDIIPLLPSFQASLNVIAATLISSGYYFIHRQNKTAHRTCMISALVVSIFFTISYLYYHAQVGNVAFAGEGAIRPVYFTILASHIILAAITLPLVLGTVTLAILKKPVQHRRIARWTLPIWLYVSVTGVMIYLMAFHLYPLVHAH